MPGVLENHFNFKNILAAQYSDFRFYNEADRQYNFGIPNIYVNMHYLKFNLIVKII